MLSTTVKVIFYSLIGVSRSRCVGFTEFMTLQKHRVLDFFYHFFVTCKRMTSYTDLPCTYFAVQKRFACIAKLFVFGVFVEVVVRIVFQVCTKCCIYCDTGNILTY